MADGVAGGLPPDEKKNGEQPETEQVSGEQPKKQKTQAQIERERERRRRRRKRKKMMNEMLKSSGETILKAGENKPEQKPMGKPADTPDAAPQNQPVLKHPQPEKKQEQKIEPESKPAQESEKKIKIRDKQKENKSEDKLAAKPAQKEPAAERVREEALPRPRPTRDHLEHEPRREPSVPAQESNREKRKPQRETEKNMAEEGALPSAKVNADTVKRADEVVKKKQPAPKEKVEAEKSAKKPEVVAEKEVREPPVEHPVKPLEEFETKPEVEEKLEDLPPIFPEDEKPEQPEKPAAESLTYSSHAFEGEDDLVIGEVKKEEAIPIGPLTEEQKHAEKNVEDESVSEEQPQENEGADVPAEKPESAEMKAEAKPEKKQIQETLQEKKVATQTFFNNIFEVLKKAGSGIAKLFGGFGGAFSRLSFMVNVRVVVPVIIVAVIAGLGYFGYSQGYYQKAVSFVSDFFKQKPAQQAAVTDVNADPLEQRQWGLTTADLFATNRGSLRDKIPSQISMATFFGELKEPRVSGETGISAATYFGEIRDQIKVVNEFVVYVEQLQKMQSLYATDVYEMLNKTTERSKVLFDYIDKLKKASEDGQRLLSDLHINVDDLNVSFNSLNADKSKYEADFFAAMDALEPEKSDSLLKGFVDISQKQVALKARISALNKLAGYYDAALAKLGKRIEAVDKNRDALIQGIRVVDVPGGNLDIIIHPEATK